MRLFSSIKQNGFVCLIGLGLAMTACGENKVATECFELQEALGNYSVPLEISQESTMREAEQAGVLAANLSELSLKTEDLSARRDQIAALYMQYGDLTSQVASFMEPDGSVVSSNGNFDDYERVSAERYDLLDRIQTEMSGLRIHCIVQ